MANEEKREDARRPRPEGEETRSLTDVYLAGAAAGAGIETGRIMVGATAGKVKDALAPKDDGPKVELPPRVEK